MSSFDGLPPGSRHTLLGLSGAKLKAKRSPESEAAQVQRLLADRSARPDRAWWDAVVAPLAVTLDAQAEWVVDSLLSFARELGSPFWLTTPLDVAKAILAHLGDWARLDDAGRQAAIEAQTFEALARDSEAVAAAVNAHGLPAAAPDLQLPLGWGDARTDSVLAAFVAAGQLDRDGRAAELLARVRPARPWADACPVDLGCGGSRDGDPSEHSSHAAVRHAVPQLPARHALVPQGLVRGDGRPGEPARVHHGTARFSKDLGPPDVRAPTPLRGSPPPDRDHLPDRRTREALPRRGQARAPEQRRPDRPLCADAAPLRG